jgi:hypothetical protein
MVWLNRKPLARLVIAVLLLSPVAGCQSLAEAARRPCAACQEGDCKRHSEKTESDGPTTPGPSPFAPFQVGK